MVKTIVSTVWNSLCSYAPSRSDRMASKIDCFTNRITGRFSFVIDKMCGKRFFNSASDSDPFFIESLISSPSSKLMPSNTAEISLPIYCLQNTFKLFNWYFNAKCRAKSSLSVSMFSFKNFATIRTPPVTSYLCAKFKTSAIFSIVSTTWST